MVPPISSLRSGPRPARCCPGWAASWLLPTNCAPFVTSGRRTRPALQHSARRRLARSGMSSRARSGRWPGRRAGQLSPAMRPLLPVRVGLVTTSRATTANCFAWPQRAMTGWWRLGSGSGSGSAADQAPQRIRLRSGSDSAQDSYDAAENLRLITGDGRIGRVVRHQPDVAVGALEGLYRRLAVDHRRDDIAVLSYGLLTDNHPVPVGNGRIDHRVADDLEQEQVPVADDLLGERENILDRLLGEDRAAGGDPADERDIDGLLRRDVHRVALIDVQLWPDGRGAAARSAGAGEECGPVWAAGWFLSALWGDRGGGGGGGGGGPPSARGGGGR